MMAWFTSLSRVSDYKHHCKFRITNLVLFWLYILIVDYFRRVWCGRGSCAGNLFCDGHKLRDQEVEWRVQKRKNFDEVWTQRKKHKWQ